MVSGRRRGSGNKKVKKAGGKTLKVKDLKIRDICGGKCWGILGDFGL